MISSIIKLVNSNIIQGRVKASKIEGLLSEAEITELIKQGILDPSYEKPLTCKYCHSSEITILEDKSHLVIKCLDCKKTYKVSKNELEIYYDVSYQAMAQQINAYLSFNSISVDDKGFYILTEFEFNNELYRSLFIPTQPQQRQLLHILFEEINDKIPTLCIVKDSAYKDVLNLLVGISSGSLIYVFPISLLIEMREDISSWLSKTMKVRELEKFVIDNIKDDTLKKLVISINTNPKYILALFMHLKSFKKLRELDWEFMEHLVAVGFRLIYASDISFGGGKDRGKRLPDNVFLVRKNNNPVVLGIVDCKSSEAADLDKELTEKYLAYLKKARSIDFLRLVNRALIFVVFDVKGESALRFYDRLKNSLEDDEYVIILPIDSLTLILEVYLNTIIHGELKLKDAVDTLESMLADLFTREYLSQLKRKYPDTNRDILALAKLFRINKEDIICELKNRLGKNTASSIKAILENYRKKEA